MTFHTGRFLLLKKFWDIAQTAALLLKIKLFHGSTYILAFANVAASISYLFSIILRLKLVIFSYEPHSEFMKDLGYWKTKSPNYRILSYLEKKAGQRAHAVLTGTKHGVELLKSYGAKGEIFRAPTAVDPEIFKYLPESRTSIRNQLMLGDNDLLVIYPGKLGGLYYEQELIKLFGSLANHSKQYFFLVATNYDHAKIKTWFEEQSIHVDRFQIRQFIPHEEIPKYLSAADLGIVNIPPTPAQKYRSPTKVAEYLLCGLPYIVCEGVSEDDEYAHKHNVGMVVQDFSKGLDEEQFGLIKRLVSSNKTETVEGCRKTGLEYRNISTISSILFQVMSVSDSKNNV